MAGIFFVHLATLTLNRRLSYLFLYIVCNVTLDARQLYSTSRLRYGQIKSLELQDHQHCWYRLIPEPGYRIELQIYRLVDTGHMNQSKYVSSFKCNVRQFYKQFRTICCMYCIS